MLKPVLLRLLPLRRIVLMLACLATTTIAVAQAPVNDPPVAAATNLGSVLQTISERSPDVLAARAGEAQSDARVQQALAA